MGNSPHNFSSKCAVLFSRDAGDLSRNFRQNPKTPKPLNHSKSYKIKIIETVIE